MARRSLEVVTAFRGRLLRYLAYINAVEPDVIPTHLHTKEREVQGVGKGESKKDKNRLCIYVRQIITCEELDHFEDVSEALTHLGKREKLCHEVGEGTDTLRWWVSANGEDLMTTTIE